MEPIKIVTPTGCIGNRGTHKETFRDVLNNAKPDCIAVDAGSLDCGPAYLGLSAPHSPMEIIKYDMDLILSECVPRKIPVIIGSAGGSGDGGCVDTTLEIVDKIAYNHKLKFRLATIRADVSKDYLLKRLKTDVIEAVEHEGRLTEEDVKACNVIVGMMGMEPFFKALDAGADVVIAGRATDNGTIAAFPVWKGADKGLALHMGDIMECGESALVERKKLLRGLGPNRIPIIGTIFDDYFLLTSGHPNLSCTPQSAAAHAMYERSSIYESVQPGGVVDRKETKYEVFDELTTKVSGTRYHERPYSILLEGAAPIGYRSLLIQGIRTPKMIEQIENILDNTGDTTLKLFENKGKAVITYHLYGKNAVLKELEFKKSRPHELGLVVDVVAESQDLAHDIALDYRLRLNHCRYDGRKTTAGNCAVLFSPSVLDVGQAFELKIFHALPMKDPCELFPVEIKDI